MIAWLKLLLVDLTKTEFTGKLVLNIHKGSISRKYEVRQTLTK
jgi:hypothetical protein